MAVDVKFVERSQLEGFFKVNKKREEYVGYWRLPATHHGGRAAHWITWADTQDGKQISQLSRGWRPLDRYGRVTGYLPDGSAPVGASWYQILSHRNGPAEFPASQVQTYRWYRPESLPEPFKDRGLAFPQLNEALKGGLEIREYSCPECHEYFYFEPWHLATHLANRHDYDRTEIIALGNQVGIDFTKSILNVMNAVQIIKEVESVVEEEDDGPIHVTRVNVQATKGFVQDVAPHSDLELRFSKMEANFDRMTSLLESQLARLSVAPEEVEMPTRDDPRDAVAPKRKRAMTPERRKELIAQLEAGRKAKKERLEAQAEALAHPEHVSL